MAILLLVGVVVLLIALLVLLSTLSDIRRYLRMRNT